MFDILNARQREETFRYIVNGVHLENAAIEIKERYKNLKEIRIKNIFESSLGVQNVDFDVVDVNNKVIKGNTTTVGKFGSFSDNGLVEGRTIGKVKVLYLNGEVGFIK